MQKKIKGLPDPTTLNRLNEMQHKAHKYIDKFYSDTEPEAPKKKRYKGTGHVNSRFDCADIHHRIVGGK